MLPFAVLAFYIDSRVSRDIFLLFAFIFLFIIFSVEIYRIRRQHLHPDLMGKIAHIDKENEQNRFLSTIWSPIDLILLGLFFSKVTVLAAICVGGFSDSLAAIIGMRFGGWKN